ncbi:MAG: choice-of-anchor Q domain-containing protein [Isosphaeraceae bacterium]
MLRRSRPQLRPAPLRRRRASCPALEPLEGRALLATFTVTNGNDSGAGSLRAALLLADQNGGADTIDFAPSVAQVSLTSGRLQINSDLTILGPSSGVTITRTSANTFGIFRVQGGVTARLEKVIINSGSDYSGGGVQNAGLLTIVSSTLSGNTGETGGAVYNSGVLTLSACTVISNTARSGGGVYNGGRFAALGTTFSGNSADFAGGALTNFNSFSIVNSTFSGNSTLGYGGAVSNEQLVDGATLEITSSTFSGNSANNLGDSIFNLVTSDPLVLNNTLVAGTSDLLSGTFTGSNNLVQDGSGTGLTGTVVADPLLGPLADNGGPTRTHAILPGSPAINAGSNALALDPQGNPLTTDQRGPTFPRIKMGTVDIGAYESPYETSSLVVTTGDDVVNPSDGLTSLREAVAYAAIKPGADTITFAPSVFAVLLTSGQITLDSNVSILGQGAVVTIARASANEFRIFDVPAGVSARLENLTVTGGLVPLFTLGGGVRNAGTLSVFACVFLNNSAYDGGAIQNYGTLSVDSSTFTGNAATVRGGGLKNEGTATVTASSFSGNSASLGGGVMNVASFTVTNSTFSGNSAASGGGIFHNVGMLKVVNSTLAANTASTGARGIDLAGGSATLNNTVVAGSGVLLSGTFAGSSNLVQDGSGTGLTGTIVADPLLGPLADNGGPTQTHALLPGSPAINAGSNALALDAQGNPLTTDQRGPGFPRILGGTVDIGSFELRSVPIAVAIVRADPDPTNAASVRFTVTFSSAVTGVDATDFQVVAPGIIGAGVTSISPAGPAGTYSVTVGTGNGDGTLQLNLVDDDTIRDASDQPLGGPGSGNGNLAGPAYTIDKTAPTVSKVFVAWGNQVYDIQNIGTTRTLPWFGIRRVDVVFSEGLANSTLLTSALNITTEVASGPAGGYSYSDATRTASWSTLGLAPATVARLLLALNTNLHDVAGNGLAISTSATKFVLSGGNYSLTTNILPGDFNGDGLVNVFDGVGIRNKFTPLINDPTAIWADMDGDGDVDPDDYNLSRGQVGKRKLSS